MKNLTGKKVRMTEEYKKILKEELIRFDPTGQYDRPDHVEEFGNCIGIVEGLVDYGDSFGPEVDVRWQPSNLRYAYHPDTLEIVE